MVQKLKCNNFRSTGGGRENKEREGVPTAKSKAMVGYICGCGRLDCTKAHLDSQRPPVSPALRCLAVLTVTILCLELSLEHYMVDNVVWSTLFDACSSWCISILQGYSLGLLKVRLGSVHLASSSITQLRMISFLSMSAATVQLWIRKTAFVLWWSIEMGRRSLIAVAKIRSSR